MVNKQSTLREMALFAGAGGGILGGHLLGWRTVCAVEWDSYAASVLCARQNDGILPAFPVWDDVQTFDGKPWRGLVDVVSGGFPCQDISCAGKGAGITGAKSSMWQHMARIIGEVRPRYAFVENSPLLVGRGAAMVIGDLTELGYDCQWGIVSASDCGAPHKRDRFWLRATSANANSPQCEGSSISSGIPPQNANISGYGGNAEASNTTSQRQQRQGQSWFSCDPAEKREGETDQSWTERVGHIWGIESNVGRVADGVAARMDRLKAIGNGQVPIVAKTAWRILNGT